MGMNYQVYRAAVNAAKGIRQFQKADKAITKDKMDSAVGHLNRGLDDFASSLSHLENAEDDALVNAAEEIDQGNEHLRKAIEAYADGKTERAESHYEKAQAKYDDALDLLDA